MLSDINRAYLAEQRFRREEQNLIESAIEDEIEEMLDDEDVDSESVPAQAYSKVDALLDKIVTAKDYDDTEAEELVDDDFDEEEIDDATFEALMSESVAIVEAYQNALTAISNKFKSDMDKNVMEGKDQRCNYRDQGGWDDLYENALAYYECVALVENSNALDVTKSTNNNIRDAIIEEAANLMWIDEHVSDIDAINCLVEEVRTILSKNPNITSDEVVRVLHEGGVDVGNDTPAKQVRNAIRNEAAEESPVEAAKKPKKSARARFSEFVRRLREKKNTALRNKRRAKIVQDNGGGVHHGEPGPEPSGQKEVPNGENLVKNENTVKEDTAKMTSSTLKALREAAEKAANLPKVNEDPSDGEIEKSGKKLPDDEGKSMDANADRKASVMKIPDEDDGPVKRRDESPDIKAPSDSEEGKRHAKVQSEIEKAMEWIRSLTEEPEVGKVYDGTVVTIKDFGAFVNILNGVDGMLHISQIREGKRLKSVDEVLKVGDKVKVKLVAMDHGKLSLSMIGVDK